MYDNLVYLSIWLVLFYFVLGSLTNYIQIP